MRGSDEYRTHCPDRRARVDWQRSSLPGQSTSWRSKAGKFVCPRFSGFAGKEINRTSSAIVKKAARFSQGGNASTG